MKRYYTPSIEEFHIGFEYQEAWGLENVNEEWIDEVFDLDSTVGGLLPRLRVKYLDQEDIESLGFVLQSSGNNRMEFHNLGDVNYYLTKIGLEVAISVRTEGMLDREINSIEIKNKSELKRILKMIGYVPD